MATTDNGWPVGSGYASRLAPGTTRKFSVRNDDAGTILLWAASLWDLMVDDIDVGVYDDWGGLVRNTRGTTTWSRHAGFIAIDIDATKHPLGKRGTFRAPQIAKLREIEALCEGTLRFGEFYSGRVDGMHVEIDVRPGDPRLAKVAAKAWSWWAARNGVTPPASVTAAPAPTIPSIPAPASDVLRKGSKGNAVKDLQQKLLARAYDCGSADGDFGDKTLYCVVEFQKAAGITADGLAGDHTQRMIAANPNYPGSGANEYRAFQQRLSDRGWKIGVDGKWGPQSQSILRKFQAEKGLAADGVPGCRSWTALFTRPL